MLLKFKWLFLGTLVIVLFELGMGRSITSDEKEFALLNIDSPSSHIALSGDFEVFISNTNQSLKESKYEYESEEKDNDDTRIHGNISYDSFLLRVLYLLEDISELVGEIPLEKLPSQNETISVVIPCGYFTRGGIYVIRVQRMQKNVAAPAVDPYQASKLLDVKWPLPTIFLESQEIPTYPDKPIRATVKYDGINCGPSENVPAAIFILQLIYCGSTSTACYLQNNTYIQILYYEQMTAFLSSKTLLFRCEFFGLPGNYAVRLKASNANPTAPNTSVYFKVIWSEEYRLTVHARSIYPCDGSGGVAVLFQYPSCRLDGDRIRVYGRLKADVTSVASPSSLHYITESRSIPGKHSLAFDCDLFTEKFVEYCFIYVSQAITGAMADVKMSCIPTFPFQEGDAAGWGPWSPWSPCSSSCFGGIRNRYRFCDTPPPKYGAKFCQGKAMETELCDKMFWPQSNKKEWHDRIDSFECHGAILAAAKPEVVAEIGSQCRCGCRIILKTQPFRKILGANTQACPGRSFWLLQAPKNFIIGLHLDQLQFPCSGQYFRVRDGNSLNANLLIDVAFDTTLRTAKTLLSSGQNLLLEFFSDELTASGDGCVGGFLAHAAVLDKKYLKKNESTAIVPFETNSTEANKGWMIEKPAHLATALLFVLMLIISIFLMLQFFIKYRKYRIAEDLDSLSDVSELMPRRSKYLSTSTLISEVISMIETATKSSSTQVLNNQENAVNTSTETLTRCKDESPLSSSTLKLNSTNNTAETSSGATLESTKSSHDQLLSAASILVYNKPEVRYAYPLKLQRIDCDTPVRNVLKMESQKFVNSRSNSITKIYTDSIANCSEEKTQESSPESIVSSPSTLGSGKETKDRRNREKLLQGPGSEFSLTNGDAELELDYYDYNVANASAVPGSYLGMDPAFLVWIPPIDDIELNTEDLLMGTKRNSILALETEGAALTPSEYRRMKLSGFEDFEYEVEQGDVISETTKSRTFDKLLPVDKLLEDSSIKISMESVSGIREHKQYCVMPNRRVYISKDEGLSDESSTCKSLFGNLGNMLDKDKGNSEKLSSNSSKVIREGYPKQNSNHSHHKIPENQDEDVISVSCKYKELMVCTQSFTNIKDVVNIPMTDLSGSPLKNIAQIRKLNSNETDASLNMHNSDYGIEAFCRKQGSFYDQNIKFVDEEDDEYIN